MVEICLFMVKIWIALYYDLSGYNQDDISDFIMFLIEILNHT